MEEEDDDDDEDQEKKWVSHKNHIVNYFRSEAKLVNGADEESKLGRFGNKSNRNDMTNEVSHNPNDHKTGRRNYDCLRVAHPSYTLCAMLTDASR